MKWMTPIWSNPIGWSEWMAKTRLRVFIGTLIHTAFIILGILLIHQVDSLYHAMGDDAGTHRFMSLMGALPLVVVGVGYPATYLYAMHRLLKIISESRPQNTPSQAMPRPTRQP